MLFLIMYRNEFLDTLLPVAQLLFGFPTLFRRTFNKEKEVRRSKKEEFISVYVPFSFSYISDLALSFSSSRFRFFSSSSLCFICFRISLSSSRFRLASSFSSVVIFCFRFFGSFSAGAGFEEADVPIDAKGLMRVRSSSVSSEDFSDFSPSLLFRSSSESLLSPPSRYIRNQF